MECICGFRLDFQHDLQSVISESISVYKCPKCKKLVKYDTYLVKVSEYKSDRKDKNQKLDKREHRTF